MTRTPDYYLCMRFNLTILKQLFGLSVKPFLWALSAGPIVTDEMFGMHVSVGPIAIFVARYTDREIIENSVTSIDIMVDIARLTLGFEIEPFRWSIDFNNVDGRLSACAGPFILSATIADE